MDSAVGLECWPDKLIYGGDETSSEQLVQLNVEDKAKDWAQVNGLGIRQSGQPNSSDCCQYAPISLIPCRFPRKFFNLALEIQNEMNLMYAKVSTDFDFIQSTLGPIATVDPFLSGLLEIYQQVHKEGISQPVFLNLQRADYMLQSVEQAGKFPTLNIENTQSGDVILRQVEVNTIASSLGSIGQRTSELHEYLLLDAGCPNQTIDQHLPKNRAIENVANGLANAWRCFADPLAAILVIIENENVNIQDQRLVEYAVPRQAGCHIPIIRLTLTEVGKTCHIDNSTKLVVKLTGKKIAVVYFRSGYSPKHYPSKSEWDARLLIERSSAIKSPWIGYHLAGSKRVQKELTSADTLAKYVTPRMQSIVQTTFAWQSGLEEVIKMPKMLKQLSENPDDFVLKPQREGGGNNLHGQDILQLIKENTSKGHRRGEQFWKQYVLMERFRPPIFLGKLSNPKQPLTTTECVCELGMFGYCIGKIEGSETDIMKNESDGYLLRTKHFNHDEGHVKGGTAFLNSPWLV